MIYGFVSDSSVLDTTSAIVESPDVSPKGVGMFDESMKNYYVKHVIMRDNRASRLNVLGSVAIGKIGIHFDLAKWDLGFDLDRFGEADRQALFNIIEKIYLSDQMTLAQLESALTSSPATFGQYIAKTLEISTTYTPDVTVYTQSGGMTCATKNWFAFSMRINSSLVQFKLWFNQAEFKTGYPLTTITDVICPCDPRQLVDPDFSNVIDALSRSAAYANQLYDKAITDDDHSGVEVHNTRYVTDPAVTGTYTMSFAVLYKGAVPDASAVRAAIRQYLLDTGIDVQVWKQIFPDLFIGATFLFTPIYDNTTQLPTKTIYPGIGNITDVINKVRARFPQLTEEYLADHMEYITCDADATMMVAFADANNESAYQSLRLLHPTFQPIDSTDPGYVYQAESTRTFNEYLCNALTIALGRNPETDEPIPQDKLDEVLARYSLNKSTINNRLYYEFAVDGVSYNLMTKESYGG